MYIRVTSCQTSSFWYKDYIGCIFEVKQLSHPLNKYAVLPGVFNEMRYPELRKEHGLGALRISKQDSIVVELEQSNDQSLHLLKRGNVL